MPLGVKGPGACVTQAGWWVTLRSGLRLWGALDQVAPRLCKTSSYFFPFLLLLCSVAFSSTLSYSYFYSKSRIAQSWSSLLLGMRPMQILEQGSATTHNRRPLMQNLRAGLPPPLLKGRPSYARPDRTFSNYPACRCPLFSGRKLNSITNIAHVVQ